MHVIIGMLIVGLIFLAVIALGELVELGRATAAARAKRDAPRRTGDLD